MNIAPFFTRANNLSYVIVKKADDLPRYAPGSDIDILTDDRPAFARTILAEGNNLLADGYSIDVGSDEPNGHTKIDFYRADGTLDLRFDIHDSLPRYRNVRVKQAYAAHVLKERKKTNLSSDSTVEVYVPDHIDDLVLRYIEYHEWFARRPDKVKHANYVEASLLDDATRTAFFERLHAYVDVMGHDIEVPEHSFSGKEKRRGNWKRTLKNNWPRTYRSLRTLRKLLS